MPPNWIFILLLLLDMRAVSQLINRSRLAEYGYTSLLYYWLFVPSRQKSFNFSISRSLYKKEVTEHLEELHCSGVLVLELSKWNCIKWLCVIFFPYILEYLEIIQNSLPAQIGGTKKWWDRPQGHDGDAGKPRIWLNWLKFNQINVFK